MEMYEMRVIPLLYGNVLIGSLMHRQLRTTLLRIVLRHISKTYTRIKISVNQET